MSSKWFTVPTRQEVAKAKKMQRRAMAAEERGEDFQEVTRKEDLERQRQARREEAAKAERELKARKDAEEKATRKEQEAAAKQRKAAAIERQKKASDPKQWPTCVEKLAEVGGTVASDLATLFDDEAYPHIADDASFRLTHAMAMVDRVTKQTVMPADANVGTALEPRASFVSSGDSQTLDEVKQAIRDHISAQRLSAVDIVAVCASLFGTKGNRVLTYTNGEGLGSRLVLQMILAHYAAVVLDELDIVSSFFFNGAAGDKSSAALANLTFVLQQLTPFASDGANRNALVAVMNNAAGLSVPPAAVARMSPWLSMVSVATKEAAAKATGKPLLLTPAGAVLLVEGTGQALAAPLIVSCAAQWNPRAGKHIFPSLLKLCRSAEDAFAETVAAMIEADPSLASQLSASFNNAASQVNAVLATCKARDVALPADVATGIASKVGSALGGKGKASQAGDYRQTVDLLKGVKAGRATSWDSRDSLKPLRILLGLAILAAGGYLLTKEVKA